MKESILTLLAVAFTMVSLSLTPTVDKIQLINSSQYPFFYANTLPFIYYVAVIYSAMLALLCKTDHHKLLSLLCVALLVEFTPSLMLVNPWLPDQYPYLSEPAYLIRNAHIAPLHYLHEVPGLGLMFSQLMLATGLGPFTISKIYSVLASIMLVLPTFFLSKKLCGNGAVIPLIFLSVNTAQINVFHRFTYFFMLFPLILLLVRDRIEKPRPESSIICILILLSVVLIYPGSVIIPIMLLLTPMLITLLSKLRGTILIKEKSIAIRADRLLYTLGLISLYMFLGWNIYVAEWQFSRMVGNVYQALTELASPASPAWLVTPQHPWAGGLTPIFANVLRARMLLVAIILIFGFLGAIFTLLRQRERLMPSMYLAFLATLVPFMFTSWAQWYAFKFVAYLILLASTCIAMFWRLDRSRALRSLRVFIAALVVTGLILIPVLRYASIPYLYVTSEELKAASFVHNRYEGHYPIYYTEYPPYIRVLVGKDPGWEFTQYLGFPSNVDLNQNNFLVVERHVTRDGYYVYSEPASLFLNRMRSSLALTHNLVYTSGNYTNLFIKAG